MEPIKVLLDPKTWVRGRREEDREDVISEPYTALGFLLLALGCELETTYDGVEAWTDVTWPHTRPIRRIKRLLGYGGSEQRADPYDVCRSLIEGNDFVAAWPDDVRVAHLNGICAITKLPVVFELKGKEGSDLKTET